MKLFISIVLSATLLCTALSGCTASPTESVDTTAQLQETTAAPMPETTAQPTKPERQKLRVMSAPNSKYFVESLVNSFLLYHPDVSIEVTELDGNSAYRTALEADLAGENRHDIVILRPTYLTYTDIMYVRNGEFADLDALNAEYGYLDWEDYDQTVTDLGIFDGKRYILPVYYTVPFLVGFPDVLEREKITYGKGVTLAEFIDSLSASPLVDFCQTMSFIDLYRHSGLAIADSYQKKADLKDPQFHDLIDLYMKLYPGRYSADPPKYTLAYDPNFYEGKVTFFNMTHYDPWLSAPQGLDDAYTVFARETGKTPILTAIPNFDGTGVSGSPSYSLAINAATQAPEAALRFLAHACSFQFYCDEKTFTHGIPINLAYNEAVRATYYGEEVKLPNGIIMDEFLWRVGALDREFIDTYYDILSRVQFTSYVDHRTIGWLGQVIYERERNGCTMEEAIWRGEYGLNAYFATYPR